MKPRTERPPILSFLLLFLLLLAVAMGLAAISPPPGDGAEPVTSEVAPRPGDTRSATP